MACTSCGYLNQDKIVHDEQLLLDTYHDVISTPTEEKPKKIKKPREIQHEDPLPKSFNLSKETKKDLLDGVLHRLKHRN